MITITPWFETITPAYNSAFLKISSDETAQDNFLYKITLTDDETSTSQEFNIPKPFVGTEINFDCNTFIRAFITNELRASSTNGLNLGFQTYQKVRKVTIDVTDVYGTPPVDHTVVSLDYQVWNGALLYIDYRNYNAADLIYDGSLSNYKVLSSQLTEKAYPDFSSFIHLINFDGGSFHGIRIISYDSSDVQVGLSEITNPYEAAGDYVNSYLSIDVGLRALETIDTSLVFGTFPILPATATYYKVYLIDYNYSTSPPTITATLVKQFNISCSPVFDVRVIHYLARSGAFDTAVFDKSSLVSSSNDRTEFSKYQYFQPDDLTRNADAQAVDSIVSSLESVGIKMNTGYLTDDEVVKYRELASSPLVYLDLGENGLQEVLLVDSNYDLLKKFNKRNRSLTMTFKASVKEVRQY